MATATFAAGCFWGIELRFSELEGVKETRVGYMGGEMDQPSYQAVCSGETGHAEVVQIDFDSQAVSFETLLDCFWQWHDPTTLNRQGPDIGTQYRSAIFYHDDTQRILAEQSRAVLGTSGVFARPIVTVIEPAATFWLAEDYHQQYLKKRGASACGI